MLLTAEIQIGLGQCDTCTERSSESIFSSSSMFCSTEVVNGSIWNGEVHSAVTGFSGASWMSRSLHSRRCLGDFDRARSSGFDAARA